VTKKNLNNNKINKKKMELVNEQILFERILLIDGDERTEMETKKALEIATKKALDLFCVSPSATPPVCKIIDYKKHLFSVNKEKRKKKDAPLKELRISYKIDKHDLNIKLRKVYD
jgi:translation initiation factor IF-3